MSYSWFKAMRNKETIELLAASSNAFVLLFVIAYRAQRTNKFNRYNLKPGQALVGDYGAYGMTEQNYRTAKKFLSTHGFATFKPTSKGTIATLATEQVFDINAFQDNEQTNDQETGTSRPLNEPPTTTNNERRDKNGKSPLSPPGKPRRVRHPKIPIQAKPHFGEDYSKPPA